MSRLNVQRLIFPVTGISVKLPVYFQHETTRFFIAGFLASGVKANTKTVFLNNHA